MRGREEELIERIKAALREDLPRSSLMTPVGLGHNHGPPFEAEPPVYDVPEFCRAHRVSRSTLYDLWKIGLGPKFLKIGASVRITREAAQAWRREREAATVQRFNGNGEAA